MAETVKREEDTIVHRGWSGWTPVFDSPTPEPEQLVAKPGLPPARSETFQSQLAQGPESSTPSDVVANPSATGMSVDFASNQVHPQETEPLQDAERATQVAALTDWIQRVVDIGRKANKNITGANKPGGSIEYPTISLKTLGSTLDEFDALQLSAIDQTVIEQLKKIRKTVESQQLATGYDPDVVTTNLNELEAIVV